MPNNSRSRSGKNNGNYKHGCKNTKLYVVWCDMKARCNRKTHKAYKYYGAKGVKLCAEWDDFSAFKEWADMNGYKEGLSIDRINNSGNYEPGNCRWVTAKQQANNQETTTRLKVIDTEKTLHEWADFIGIKPATIHYRLRHGWDIEKALFTKVNGKH